MFLSTHLLARLKEKGIAKEIVAVTIGPKASHEVLRTAIALCADEGIHVEVNLLLDTITIVLPSIPSLL